MTYLFSYFFLNLPILKINKKKRQNGEKIHNKQRVSPLQHLSTTWKEPFSPFHPSRRGKVRRKIVIIKSNPKLMSLIN